MHMEEVRKILQIVPSEEVVLCQQEKQAIRNYIAVGVSVIIGFISVGMKRNSRHCGKMVCSAGAEMNIQKP